MSSFSLSVDPLQVDSGLTLYYVDKYFSHVDNATYGALPKEAFVRWVKTSSSKSPADKMLLYAILAMGSVFSRRPESDMHRSIFADMAREAASKSAGTLSIQLIQTRLILAMLAFSQGWDNLSWDFCGSAVRTAFGMRLNTEEGVRRIHEDEELDYGLEYPMLVECRRRTFWSAYIMDCFNGCCSASMTRTYSRSDCRLRLPCAQHTYERGEINLTSFALDGSAGAADGTASSPGQVSRVGLLGYLVEIATIFHEVLIKINQPESPLQAQDHTSVDGFYPQTMDRLQAWDEQLKDHLQRTRGGRDESEPVSGLHLLYHYTMILVHRHVRHGNMVTNSIITHVGGAYGHARLMLEMVQRLCNDEARRDPIFRFATTSPFSGFAITAALDVITAAGTLSDLMNTKSQMMALISGGVEALESLEPFWDSARRQRGMIKQRLSILLSANKRASDFNGAFYFGKPMQSPFGLEQDIVYGLARMRYFQALGWDHRIHTEGDFHRLDRDDTANSAN
jgi:hypothetical protein